MVTTPIFSVTARDADAGDTLHFRLIADYPEPIGAVIA